MCYMCVRACVLRVCACVRKYMLGRFFIIFVSMLYTNVECHTMKQTQTQFRGSKVISH